MKYVKTVGRILCLAAGIMLLATAIPFMIEDINYLNTNNAWTSFTDETARTHMFSVVGQGLNCVGGVMALVAAMLGRKSFLLALYAIVMMINPVYVVVTGVQAGTLNYNWDGILKLLAQFGIPVIYFLGCLLV